MTTTAKVITILVCTTAFAILGLVAGYLITESIARVDGTMLLVSYFIAPSIGTLVGFVLSISTVRMCETDDVTPPTN